MAKSKTTAFFCTECGYESAKWAGQCPACKAWNTMTEEPSAPKIRRPGPAASGSASAPVPSYLSEISLDEKDRYGTGFTELDRVLGGGIVNGSLLLVGGDPGIGKSTLLLQVCANLAADGRKVLYISGEESLKQIKMRASRVGTITGELRFLCETSMADIEQVIAADRPDVCVIDSIQTMYCDEIASAPGSVSQVREVTNRMLQIAKIQGTAVWIVGHVTKDGQVAGPRVLEHMVDTVLYFEGDGSSSYRVLRGVKNRFGSTNEIGVFEMGPEGLTQVANPSEYMLSGRPAGASGSAVACSMEGTRPMLLEVQALVNRTAFGQPRRTAAGTDVNRVHLLLAVLEKRCRIPMSSFDAYINIAGGMRLTEPALDLAIVMAVVSSYNDVPISEDTVFFGEIGLSGEVRSVAMAEQRVREAQRLGFRRVVLPQAQAGRIRVGGIECIGVATLAEVMRYAAGEKA